jgi:hypothetical protein
MELPVADRNDQKESAQCGPGLSTQKDISKKAEIKIKNKARVEWLVEVLFRIHLMAQLHRGPVVHRFRLLVLAEQRLGVAAQSV